MRNIELDRRCLLKAAAVTTAGIASGMSIQADTTPTSGIRVLNPRARVPLSFIIDDSTCLVNMGHFCMPQFAEAWPDRQIYKQPWREWPREIPDAFVREFGEWCHEHGVKGKYSIVPYPACVGWLDRGLPGWSRAELESSIQLVRDLMLPDWDIHPEMITHTRVIDIATGRPVQGANASTMENSYPQSDKSVDELASYLAFALRILKNIGLPCEGITTPGGFGTRVKDKLPIAVHQAVRDVFNTELPHYFKYVVGGDESTQPKLEFVGTEKSASNLTMNIPAGTGDWFGGWEGSQPSQGHRYANADATRGRMVELIERGEPAIMLCHWPGMYCNGTKSGFEDFKKVVIALHGRFADETIWMKISDIGRYWAAKEMSTITTFGDNTIAIDSPIACRSFTIEIDRNQPLGNAALAVGDRYIPLRRVASKATLQPNTFTVHDNRTIVCLDLPKGEIRLSI